PDRMNQESYQESHAPQVALRHRCAAPSSRRRLDPETRPAQQVVCLTPHEKVLLPAFAPRSREIRIHPTLYAKRWRTQHHDYLFFWRKLRLSLPLPAAARLGQTSNDDRPS